jgi:hypothetical protein
MEGKREVMNLKQEKELRGIPKAVRRVSEDEFS